MKIRSILITVAVAAVAVCSFALTPEQSEWGKVAQVVMSKEEIAQWKAVKSDEEANKFVALFWARRDPTPETPRNEFREDFEARVAGADTNFAAPKMRGALTDRGKVLILFGQPSKIQRVSGSMTPQPSSTSSTAGEAETSPMYIFTYEGDAAKAMFNAARTQFRFIDRLRNDDFRLDRGLDAGGAQQRVIAAAIKQPNLTAPPSFEAPKPVAAATVPMSQVVPASAIPVQTELTTDALKTAVADFKKSSKSEKPIYATSGEYVTGDGVTYAPVLVYIPKASAPGANATFFGVVEDASGKNVLAFEEPAKPVATKDDFFVEKSLTLPAGTYRGYFGIDDAGKVSVTEKAMELKGSLDKDATAVSQLILANNIYPMETAQQPTDPFAFGGLKVVPKGDRTFHTSDDLWYFIELRNPGLAEDLTPKMQVKLEVEGTLADGKKSRMAAPPMEVAVTPIKGVPNHFAVGSSIPLQTFQPGDYTFTAKLIDTVKKTSYTFTEKFKVVQ